MPLQQPVREQQRLQLWAQQQLWQQQQQRILVLFTQKQCLSVLLWLCLRQWHRELLSERLCQQQPERELHSLLFSVLMQLCL